MAVGGHGRSAVRVRVAAAERRRAVARARRRRRASLRSTARIPVPAATGNARTHRLLPHTRAPGGAARARGHGGDQAPPPRSTERVERLQAPRRSLGPLARSRPLTPQARGDGGRRHGGTDAGRSDRARTIARLSGDAVVARGGPARAGRVRPDAIGQVRRDRDPEHPRMARTGDRRLDQTRPARRDPHHPRKTRRSAGVRPLRPLEPADQHLVAARQRSHLERGARDRPADRLRRRQDTSTVKGGISGPKPPSNASHRCSTPPPAPAAGSTRSSAGSTARAAPN